MVLRVWRESDDPAVGATDVAARLLLLVWEDAWDSLRKLRLDMDGSGAHVEVGQVGLTKGEGSGEVFARGWWLEVERLRLGGGSRGVQACSKFWDGVCVGRG